MTPKAMNTFPPDMRATINDKTAPRAWSFRPLVLVRHGLFAVILCVSPSLAEAEKGEGPYPRPSTAFGVPGARPLASLGDDVIRYTQITALDHRIVVVELRAVAGKGAIGTLYLSSGGGHRTFRRGTLLFGVSQSDYTTLAANVDAAMAAPQKDFETTDGEMIVCADAPSHLVERRAKGRTHWLSGDCGVNSGQEVGHLIGAVVAKGLQADMRLLGVTLESDDDR